MSAPVQIGGYPDHFAGTTRRDDWWFGPALTAAGLALFFGYLTFRAFEATHVFYCALQARPTWAEHNAPNLAMLVNAVDAIDAASSRLQHVHLAEGTKFYGTHLGPFRTPAREDDPPHMLPNFYFDQEMWLRERQRGASWSWSALRPQTCSASCMPTRRSRNTGTKTKSSSGEPTGTGSGSTPSTQPPV